MRQPGTTSCQQQQQFNTWHQATLGSVVSGVFRDCGCNKIGIIAVPVPMMPESITSAVPITPTYTFSEFETVHVGSAGNRGYN